jgi:hypothetical protein
VSGWSHFRGHGRLGLDSSVRGRDTGIWQPVTLTATDTVKIGDPQVVASLLLPDTTRADVVLHVPLKNIANSPVTGTLKAAFGEIAVTKPVSLAEGGNAVTLDPAEFPQLTVQHPHLWWLNGYANPNFTDCTSPFPWETWNLTGKNCDLEFAKSPMS